MAALSDGAGPLVSVVVAVSHSRCVSAYDLMMAVESHWVLMMFSVI